VSPNVPHPYARTVQGITVHVTNLHHLPFTAAAPD
jgi:hypothetical protein